MALNTCSKKWKERLKINNLSFHFREPEKEKLFKPKLSSTNYKNHNRNQWNWNKKSTEKNQQNQKLFKNRYVRNKIWINNQRTFLKENHRTRWLHWLILKNVKEE